MNGLETEFEADIVFDRIDASSKRGRAAMQVYSLRGHPSYALLDENGEVLWRFAGQMDEARLRAQLTALRR